MVGNELPLAAMKDRKLVEGEGLTGAGESCLRMAEVREGEWLSRCLESCHELVGVERHGGVVVGCRELSKSGENSGKGRGGLELSWASSK